jgi:putative endonuclease
MTYCVYILFSEILNRFYIGSSSNPQERLIKHLANHKGYTAKAKDWKIVYVESFTDKSSALAREKQLKAWKNVERLKALIDKNLK